MSEISEPRLFDNLTPEGIVAAAEREAVAKGLPCARWGSGRELLNARAEEAGPLCSDCQLKFEDAAA